MKQKILLLSTAILVVSFFAISFQYQNKMVKESSKIFKAEKPQPGPDLRPYEWAWLQRTYPYYNADPSAGLEAVRQAHLLREKQRAEYLAKGKELTPWEFAGPINIGGRVVDVEFNPINPNIVYAAAATGGVFKSTDTGISWFPVFDDNAVLTIGDIGIDPLNPNIIYVGTGEANGGHNNFPGAGIFKSTDAGLTWQHKGLTNTASIGRVVIHPTNPQILYVAAVGSYFAPNPERGVYKSTDGGETWNLSLFISDSTGAIDIVIDPSNPDFLYAAMWERVRRPTSAQLYGPTSGIYRSTNGGATWTELTSGLPDPNSENIGRIGLAICKTQPNILYSIYTTGSTYRGLFRSDDYGNTWVNADPNNIVATGSGTFSWYFGQVRVHPVNPDIVYAMDVSFMRSTDGGLTWPVIYGYGGPSELYVDHHALAFHPDNPNYIINGNDAGINISTDGGVTWAPRAWIPVTQFYEIGLDYNNPQRLYGGTQDNNTIRTLTGALDDWTRILGGDGFYVNIDPTNPNVIYAEWQFGNLYKSTNGGNNFFQVMNGINSSDPRNWSTPVVMDPNNNNVLYYGTNKLYRTTNGAANWSAISPMLTFYPPGNRLGTLTTIAVAPSNSNVIYVGTDDAQVWVSTNYGTNWTNISAGLPNRWVTRVVVDPYNEDIVYVTFSGLKWRDPQPHVFRSTNKGAVWTNISGNLPDAPLNAFAVDLRSPHVIYAGGDVGAFVSFDIGETWEPIGEGLPVVSVYDMKIHPTANYLAVGTHGRSMYKIDLYSVVGIKPGEPVSPYGYNLVQNYPNPFNPATTIEYSLPQAEFVSLKIYDLLGQELKSILNEIKPAGNHKITFSAEGLSSGIYLYSIEAGKFKQTRKMVYIK